MLLAKISFASKMILRRVLSQHPASELRENTSPGEPPLEEEGPRARAGRVAPAARSHARACPGQLKKKPQLR